MLNYIRNDKSAILREVLEAENLEQRILKENNNDDRGYGISNKSLLEKKDKKVVKLFKKCFKDTQRKLKLHYQQYL